jgi:predicted MPP superfamily phosphohydrolase
MKGDFMNRRMFLKRLLLGTAAVGAIGMGYSIQAERFRYETVRQRIIMPRLPAAFNGIRIVQISDIHLGYHYTADDFRIVVEKVAQERPDLICFTGDLYDFSIGEDAALCVSLLQSLAAPLGKFAILGNHDYYTGVEQTREILHTGGFTLLRNEHRILQRGEELFCIAGVDDLMGGYPNMDQTLKGINTVDEGSTAPFTLLMAHEANFADKAAQYQVDLQLSGHSHGGQIRLPFFGAMVKPPYGDKYVSGLYRVPGSEMLVYTNRGIGTTKLPFRFLCRPEITILTLAKG